MNRDNVVYISSSINGSFGSGFVVDRDDDGVFILTCQHVLDEVDIPIVNSIEARVIATNSKYSSIDMAVLYVKGVHVEPLTLQIDSCDSLDVEVIGFSLFNQELKQKENISATLFDKSIELLSTESGLSHNARKIEAKDGFDFERGNSGSPVICKSSGNVIAMVSNKRGSSIGYAVDISHLRDIWEEIPPRLFKNQIPLSLLSITSKKKRIPVLKYLISIFFILIILYVGYRIPYKLERDRLYSRVKKITLLSQSLEHCLRDNSISAKAKIQDVAYKYAKQLNAIEDKYLNHKLKIYKYSKVAYGYTMALTCESSRETKIDFAKKVIIAGEKALELISEVNSNPASNKIAWDWITKDDTEKHVKLFIARAYAMQVNIDEKKLSSKEEKFIKDLCTWYYKDTELNKNKEMEFFLKEHPTFCPSYTTTPKAF